LIYPSGDYFL